MSRDPLDELFGPESSGAAQPARSTPPIAASRADMPTEPVPTGRRRSPALPWVVVAIVGILAIVGSLFVVNLVQRGSDPGGSTGGDTSESSDKPGDTSPSTSGGTTSSGPTTGTSTSPSPTTTTPGATTGGTAPKVDVGANPYRMEIGAADIAVEVSQKLGSVEWHYLTADVPAPRVMIHSPHMASFPESCQAMRSMEGKSPWGIQDAGNGKWIVVRPAGTCAADTKLYDEVWGLMQAMADSVQPLEEKD